MFELYATPAELHAGLTQLRRLPAKLFMIRLMDLLSPFLSAASISMTRASTIRLWKADLPARAIYLFV